MKTAWCAIVAAGILAAPGVQAAPPTVGECMALTPGIKFSKNNGDVQANVEATFAGRRLHGTQLLIDDDVLLATYYQDIRDGQVQLAGMTYYNQDGTVRSNNVYTPHTSIPVKMRPGQQVRVRFTDTETGSDQASPGQSGKNTATIRSDEREFSMTFLGWERLELGGRRFPDACKFELHDVGGKSKGRSGDHVWYAQGFGLIMTDKLDVDGKVLPAQRIALQKIISAP
ncbi:hypothetical protein [Janthinobacterium psychrotolerans]|uniref:Lipoprotein n=1 Tax=Janthinobacterium psychrotolerans TaxID=1747903 RepID=A0A1A7C360_9BURK|nr:hypothetical protein [Janthinobacterium psychrotolerans]OBV40167.1 hypothetical protein ASR47_101482 [Janthinobacterium psychrotolerans]